jgi:hypothetical protein
MSEVTNISLSLRPDCIFKLWQHAFFIMYFRRKGFSYGLLNFLDSDLRDGDYYNILISYNTRKMKEHNLKFVTRQDNCGIQIKTIFFLFLLFTVELQ